MSVRTLPTPRTARLRSTGDLVDALGLPFSDEQLAAIVAPLEPGVIVAGAGSGKTTVMAARVVWLVGTGAARPEQVLGLTFTRKAAAELSGRVRAALVQAGVVDDRAVDESGEQLIMTYDAFAARLVSEHGLRLGFEADPSMVSGATRYRLAARVVRAAAGPFEFLSRLRPATVTERVLKLDADLQQHLVGVQDLDGHARDLLRGWASAPLNNRGNVYVDVARATAAVQERLELASLVRDYQALKTRLGVVEFADQMATAARLAVEVPAVSEALRASFGVVLLDEYQDTSAAQAAMLSGLFSGFTPASGLGHPVTAVGDPFQAIYGWRGAAASNITSFDHTFRRVDGRPARRFALTVNRRSAQSILDVANVLSRPLRHAQGDQPEQEGQGLLQAPAGTRTGQVSAATFVSWPEEVSWIADAIVAARSAGTVGHWADVAVLTRRNADIAPLYAELSAREVPVEIVGLGGLLGLPEMMDVTAVLRLVDDVTANPDLIRLLTGPRWRIGPRDLALLGRRAHDLARQPRPDGSDPAAVDAVLGGQGVGGEGLAREGVGGRLAGREEVLSALAEAVADVDPTEVVSLLDALEDPGELPYSAAARRRFERVAAELAYLRRHADEPLLDLVRRVVVTLGLDVELVATPEFARTSRRDQLGAFTDAVAAYVDVDGDASLSGLLAYLQAEIDQGAGLEQAVPSDREAVKLLTVHKAKGLEWEMVFLPGLVQGVFPSDRVSDNWVANAAVLPADLRGDRASIPQLSDTDRSAIAAYKAQLRTAQELAEDRLAYVAATRAKGHLCGTGHSWRPDLVRPRTPSDYLRAIVAEAEEQDRLLVQAPVPVAGAPNPLVTQAEPTPWPAPLDADALARREVAAAAVRRARRRFAETGRYADPAAPPLFLDTEEVVAGWDADLERLLAELAQSRSGERSVELPDSLSASALLRLRADRDAYAAALARPMPVPPSRAARFGTRFHAFVEQWFGARLPHGGLAQQPLIDPDDLPDRADPGGAEETELRELCDAFVAGRFGTTLPCAVETPFSLTLAGRTVRGRIDAVYAVDAAGPGTGPSPVEVAAGVRYLVVDWKTSRREPADPLQLAIYRVAWAEVTGVAIEQVDAVFGYVRTDTVVRPAALPERAELERLLTPDLG